MNSRADLRVRLLQERIVRQHVLRQVVHVQARPSRRYRSALLMPMTPVNGDVFIGDVEHVVRLQRLARHAAPGRPRRDIRRPCHRPAPKPARDPPGAHHVDRTGEDRPCRSVRRPLAVVTSMPPPAAGRTDFTSTPSFRSPPAAMQTLFETLEHGAIAAAHVAHVLGVRLAVARGEQALDVRPDEHGRNALVVLAELGEQQRLPELLEHGAAAMAHQPILDGDLLEPAPVVDARAVEDGQREPELVPQRQRREVQELGVVGRA